MPVPSEIETKVLSNPGLVNMGSPQDDGGILESLLSTTGFSYRAGAALSTSTLRLKGRRGISGRVSW